MTGEFPTPPVGFPRYNGRLLSPGMPVVLFFGIGTIDWIAFVRDVESRISP